MAFRRLSANRQPPIERFWSKVDKDGPIPEACPEIGPCWIWTAGLSSEGYGVFALETDWQWLAHRFSFGIHYGALTKGLVVCHHCDVRRCVNPFHLFEGTQAVNMDDMTEKGRRSDAYLTTPNKPKGEQHYRAVVTAAIVQDIRHLHADGVSYVRLAQRFSISPSQIARIVTRASWAHVS